MKTRATISLILSIAMPFALKVESAISLIILGVLISIIILLRHKFIIGNVITYIVLLLLNIVQLSFYYNFNVQIVFDAKLLQILSYSSVLFSLIPFFVNVRAW